MSAVEIKKFSAEVDKILHLVIHSLYANKEIFLRELISNASDACDKLRCLSQTNASLLENDPNLKINVSLSTDNKYLIIQDNGIGMNKEDLENNLGSIASSGTQKFLEQLQESDQKNNSFIGQFGVGFYSSYMVADHVVVMSKKAGEETAYEWSSDGKGEYQIQAVEVDFQRGTKITLHLKEGNNLDHFRIKQIIKDYSDHISIPIFYFEENKPEQQINASSALWAKPQAEISKEQYEEFYRGISYSIDKPWVILHNKNEGLVEFTNLLFVPSTKTFDLFHPDRKRRIKLYIKRVFITDENVELVPKYMRFLRGIIDSDDLPLNVSRETLQYSASIDKIRNFVVKRVLNELKKRKDDHRSEYENFWTNFGAVLKEGLCEADTDHEKLLELCLFKSALHDKFITLDEYISNLPADQKNLYYLSGEDAELLKSSPQIEGFLSRGIDVLLFTDPVDTFWSTVANKYKDYEITSVTRSNIKLGDQAAESDQNSNEKSDEQYSKLIEYFSGVLGNNVKAVQISKKLTSSPVCLAVAEGDMDIRMERLLIEQKQLHKASARILEINPNHKIISKINDDLQNNANLNNDDLVLLLLDQACIIDGEPLVNPNACCSRMNDLIAKMIV